MSARYPPIAVRVWGDFACFTRPENKVERVSYPVPTPSAARGMLESIFWKPEFAWRIEEIWVLRPIRYFSILRNEVNSKATHVSARRWEKEGGGYVASEDRAQRHTLALRDVDYVIYAQVELRPHATEDEAKYRDQARRRIETGKCFHRPALGCREFAANFGKPEGNECPISVSDDLGRILYDLNYQNDGTGRGTPIFFEAKLQQGILHVPSMEELNVATAIG